MSSGINFHRAGAGPLLVLLHGVGHHWQAWRPVIDRLTESFEAVACDSPGFGRSVPLAGGVEPTIPAYADAFADFFAAIGLERPHIAGNSMGGAIALELARRGQAGSVTAFSPAGFWSPVERRFCQLSLGLLGGVPQAVRPGLRALAATRAGRVILFRQTFGRPTRMPPEEAMATLDDGWAAPALAAALVAWGRYDRLLIYELQAPRARERLPWARHFTLGAGHVPFFDDPGAVAETIRLTALPPR